MDVYRRDTQKIIDQFLDNRITFNACTAALDAAWANLAHGVTGETNEVALRIVTSVNHGIVTREMERRNASTSQQTHSE